MGRIVKKNRTKSGSSHHIDSALSIHYALRVVAMHLIIDGYNLLGVRGQVGPAVAQDGDSAREQLLRDLMVYQQRKAHSITVVFDGWQQGAATEGSEHRAGVQVIYSRRGERADQVIQRLVEKFGRDVAVVSSDREITDFARVRGAFVIEAREFEVRLRAKPHSTATVPLHGRDPKEDDPPRRSPDKKGNPRKLPKALRKRNRQLRGF